MGPVIAFCKGPSSQTLMLHAQKGDPGEPMERTEQQKTGQPRANRTRRRFPQTQGQTQKVQLLQNPQSSPGELVVKGHFLAR